MTLEARRNAAINHHAARQRQQQQQQQHIGDIVAAHIAHRIGMRITNGLEYMFWGSCDHVVSAYHWMWPTTAEHVRKMAIFTRRDLDTFIREATTQGRQHIVVQSHRITDIIRQQYVRDGYDVSTVNVEGKDAVKIAWGDDPVIAPVTKKCDVAPSKPA